MDYWHSFEPLEALDTFLQEDTFSAEWPFALQEEPLKQQKSVVVPVSIERKSARGPSLNKATAPLPATSTQPTRRANSIKLEQQEQQQQPIKQQKAVGNLTKATGRSGSADETDFMSEDMDDMGSVSVKGNNSSAGCKRPRAPDMDWRAIQDPAERRRQRRLAKNRITAALSRERKKLILSELEMRLQSFEVENARLQTMLAAIAKENSDLKQQLLGNKGAVDSSSKGCGKSCSSPSSTSVKIFLATTLLLLCVCNLSGEQQGLALAQGAVPLVLMWQVLEEEGCEIRNRKKQKLAKGPAGSSSAAFDALVRFAAALSQTTAHMGQAWSKSIRRLLYAHAPPIPAGMFSVISSSSKQGGSATGGKAGMIKGPWLPAKPALRSSHSHSALLFTKLGY